MGSDTKVKPYILAAVFLLSCFFVYGQQRNPKVVNKPALADFFQKIGDYRLVRQISLGDDHVSLLSLDDYFFADFQGKHGTVNLYIGYYYTAGKAYAAHSPLVCYPSQGWKIDRKPVRQSFAVGKHTIIYEEIITSLGERKELVVYWFQAGPFTNTQVYMNKIDMGYNKFVNNSEEHAFVRITVPLTGSSTEQALQTAQDFMSQFYPMFLAFIQAEKNQP